MQPKLAQRLDALSKAFSAGNIYDIKKIANDSINDATISFDHDMAKIAVIAYALYKMLTKEHFVQNPKWKEVAASITISLQKSTQAALQGKHRSFKRNLKDTIQKIENIDDKLSHFAKNIYEKAKMKQASTAYALGLSLSQAAELTGAAKKELQHYIGETRIHDEEPTTTGIKKRIIALKEITK
jgi:hypothetical protein